MPYQIWERITWYISNPQQSQVKQATSKSGLTSPTRVHIPWNILKKRQSLILFKHFMHGWCSVPDVHTLNFTKLPIFAARMFRIWSTSCLSVTWIYILYRRRKSAGNWCAISWLSPVFSCSACSRCKDRSLFKKNDKGFPSVCAPDA